jgi:hypothetical protein
MRKFFENRLAFAATVLAFAMALGVSALYGSGTVLPSQAPLPNVVTSAVHDDPTVPPFPCPSCPPDGSLTASTLDDPTVPPFPCPSCPPDGSASLIASAKQTTASFDDPTVPPFPCPSCPPDGATMLIASTMQTTAALDDPTVPPFPCPSCPPDGTVTASALFPAFRGMLPVRDEMRLVG